MQKVIDLARNQSLGIKPIDSLTNSSNSSNYLNSGLLPLPNASQSIKSNLSSNRTTSRSPDRRPISSRSMDRENRIRDRSRSPLRNERDRSLNGNAGTSLNRMGSMNSGIMNTIRDASVHNPYPPNESVRSRLSYSEAILPNGIPSGLQEGRGRQWPTNDSYEMTASGDFNRDLQVFRDNRSRSERRQFE